MTPQISGAPILPDLILPSRANQCWTESGMDDYDHCLDREHFLSYPHAITYQYNSRGFRDREWPNDPAELRNAIWCIGDSFTVGIGSPVEHTWCYQVEKVLNRRVINVSMDGASNNWIARRAIDVYRAIKPTNMIIMWSYMHRRENNDTTLSDEDRRLWHDINPFNEVEDIENFVNCVNEINKLTETKCIHFLIPHAGPGALAGVPGHVFYNSQQIWNRVKGIDWPAANPMTLDEYSKLPQFVLDELNFHRVDQTLKNELAMIEYTRDFTLDKLVKWHGKPIRILDWARDKHHFDILTSCSIAEEVAQILKNQ